MNRHVHPVRLAAVALVLALTACGSKKAGGGSGGTSSGLGATGSGNGASTGASSGSTTTAGTSSGNGSSTTATTGGTGASGSSSTGSTGASGSSGSTFSSGSSGSSGASTSTGSTGLAAPANLVATPGVGQITLTWDPVPGAISYALYWSATPVVGTSSGSRIVSATAPYVHANLTDGATYWYAVTASDASGESTLSNVASARVGDTSGPLVVAGTSPATGSVGAQIGGQILAMFNAPLDPVTVNASTFLLADSSGNAVAGTVAYSGLTATFTPSAPLQYDTYYQATLKASETALDGRSLGNDAVFGFTTQPPAPTGLTAIPGNGELSLTWPPIAGAQEYLVHNAGHVLATVHGSGFTWRNAPNASDSFTVSVITADGESPESASVSATPSSSGRTAPTRLTASARNAQVALSWQGSAGSYEVLRATNAGGPYTSLGQASSAAYVDDTASNGTTYYYVVRDLGGTGSAYSDEAIATPSASLPAAPANFSATAGSTWVRLSWSAVSGAQGYVVLRASQSQGPYGAVGFPSGTSFDDLSVTNGSTYYYVVAATGGTQLGSYLAETAAAPSTSGLARAPAVRAYGENNQVMLTWASSPGAQSYKVQRSTTAGGPYTVVGSPTGASYTDTSGVTNGVTYYYVVSAETAGGSAQSAEVSVVPTNLVAAPQNLVARSGNGVVTLTWDPVPGAVSYGVYMATSPSGPWSFPGCCAVTRTMYSTSGQFGPPTNGNTYYFVVVASNQTNQSGYSSVVSAAPSASYPTIPTAPSVFPGNGHTVLTWAPKTGVDHYNVYRGSAPLGAWSSLGSSTNGFFDDAAATNDAAFEYAYAAVDAQGNESGWSPPVASKPSEAIPPQPTGVRAMPGNNGISLVWDPVPGASGYGGLMQALGGSVTNGYGSCCALTEPYVDFNSVATNGTTYLLSAQTTGKYTSPSPPAVPIEATPSAVGAQESASLSSVPGQSAVTLYWPFAAGASAYEVLRREVLGGTWQTVGTTADGIFTDTSAINGVDYTYGVSATADGGEGPMKVTHTTPRSWLPDAPAGVDLHGGNADATAIWDLVPGATQYVTVSNTAPAEALRASCCDQEPDHVFGTAVSNGSTYYAMLQTVNPQGSSAFSAVTHAAVSGQLPLDVASFTGSGGDAQAALAWTAVAGATAYNLYRREPDAGWAPLTTVVDGPFLDYGLVDGVPYEYAVEPQNGVGTGAWTRVTVTPTAQAPLAPRHLRAYAGNGEVTLTWDPVPGATGYEVLFDSQPDGTFTQSSCCGFTSVLASASAVGASPTNGTPVSFVVRAHTATTASAWSNVATATPDGSLPTSVTPSVSPGPNTGELQVQWQALSGATSYLVFRRDTEGAWTFAGQTSDSQFIDEGLASGTTYQYALAAMNGSGAGAWSGAVDAVAP